MVLWNSKYIKTEKIVQPNFPGVQDIGIACPAGRHCRKEEQQPTSLSSRCTIQFHKKIFDQLMQQILEIAHRPGEERGTCRWNHITNHGKPKPYKH
jgi:hypothetical protein